jgi:hypothetical protein
MGRKNTISGIKVEVGTENQPRVPSWFSEGLLIGKYRIDSGLVGYLEEEVRVERGQMGHYEVMDFVLLLISYAVSGERTLPSAPAKRARSMPRQLPCQNF